MSRMYLSTSLAWGEPLIETIQRAHALGASGVEVWAEQVWRQSEDPIRLKAEGDRLSVGRTVHGPSWDLNLCSINSTVLKASVKATLDAVELTERLGADILVVHPGRSSLNGYFDTYHRAELKRSYVEICVHAGEHGVRIGLEAMERLPKEFLCGSQEVNDFLGEVRSEGVENIGVVVDVAHLTTISDDPLRAIADFQGLIELHISNTTPGKLHTPLDDGTLDFSKLLPSLEEQYRVPIVIEGISVSSGYDLLTRNAKAYLRAIG